MLTKKFKLGYCTKPGEEEYADLVLACEAGYRSVLTILLEKNITVECPFWQMRNNNSCLGEMIHSRNWPDMNERLAMFDTFVQHGANPHFLWSSGFNLLNIAVKNRSLEFITHLVKKYHLPINLPDSFGDTALHDASFFGYEEVVKLLLDLGANPLLLNTAKKKASDITLNLSVRTMLIKKEQELFSPFSQSCQMWKQAPNHSLKAPSPPCASATFRNANKKA